METSTTTVQETTTGQKTTSTKEVDYTTTTTIKPSPSTTSSTTTQSTTQQPTTTVKPLPECEENSNTIAWYPSGSEYYSMFLPIALEENQSFNEYLESLGYCYNGKVADISCVLTDQVRSMGKTCEQALDIQDCAPDCPSFDFKVKLNLK